MTDLGLLFELSRQAWLDGDDVWRRVVDELIALMAKEADRG